ncbi:MAG: periplasmic heavy metal sensor [Lentisphaerae bacterium]|nr:periplasmic heavy metal sensor [Lentisphaerota bacterium]
MQIRKTALFIGVVYLVFGINAAEPHHPLRPTPGKPEKGFVPDGKAEDGCMGHHLTRELGLNEEQQLQMCNINKELHAELSKLNEQREKAKILFEQAMAQERPDEQTALDAFDALYQINAEIVRVRIKSRIAICDLLTSEQNARLNELRNQMHNRRRNYKPRPKTGPQSANP